MSDEQPDPRQQEHQPDLRQDAATGADSPPEPYYVDDFVTLYHGDCLDILPMLNNVDLIVTSPPYNLGASPWPHLGHWKQGRDHGGNGKWVGGVTDAGVPYDDHDDTMGWDTYVDWQRAVLTASWASLSETGAIFYNHKPRVVGDRLWTPDQLNPGLPCRQIIVWARAGGMNFSPTAYMPTHEWITIYAKDAFRLRDRSASGVGDVWRITQDTDNPHPASFPIGVPARAIETVKRPTLVVDPHSGSGTTCRAAKDAGIRSIGIDISERYCEMAAKRLSQDVLDFGLSGLDNGVNELAIVPGYAPPGVDSPYISGVSVDWWASQ